LLARLGNQRVVITGLGAFSSIGIGADDFGDGLRAGRSGVAPLTAFNTSGYDHANGCPVLGFEPERWLRIRPVERLGRASQFAAAAARMAVRDAGLTEADLRSRRGQVSIGTTDGESHDSDRLTELEVTGGPGAMDPVLARRVTADRLSAAVAWELGLTDVEAVTFATACSAGNYSIANGLDTLRLGDADFALCGGADAVCRKSFTAFYRLGTVAPDVCRPFDRGRQGILNGEGAGVVMLEPLAAAQARGARIYAEVLGYGINCDACHPVAPEEASVARCMELALQDAGVRPADVGLISAHGTGTRANDITETRAIHHVYGDKPPPTVSIKSMIGHTMGAASALAAIACALAITQDFIPPTINHVETDPECDIDCVPNQSVPADLRIVQNNGLAFGGNNAVVVLGRYEGSA
jgi:3-oxoacyl-[acyl-carrier-protein] synthase II